MEVGAVKQAFNNEIILLKNNLNQARTQTINKLTRKAKTLAEKKAPEPLKEKLKRKAESAVKEVLIIKKIKPRDIARFIVTHTGKLNDFLNKPTVDNDKACARLLLHKALQEKYKLIRGKFSNISIKDLFMSRQERLKLKKEAKEKQKNKKKAKQSKDLQTVNVEGEWDVEMTDASTEKNANNTTNNNVSDSDNDNEDNVSVNENNDIESEANDSGNENNDDESDDDVESDEPNVNVITYNNTIENTKSDSEESDSKEIEHTKIVTVNSVVKKKPLKVEKKTNKHKEKNKNLNEKMQKRKFNNKSEDVSTNAVKIVDPFFKTSSGENYMSLVEPRQPDEVKEVHKEGNRKYRRAVMFGHVPKIKPQKRNFEPKNEKKRDNVINNKKNRSNQNNFKTEVSKEVPEKLHPSWEAKKKQSTILPFKGKKIVFDES